MTSPDLFYVFVYGTLKRGFPNHDESLLGKFYCGACESREPFPLVVAGPYFSPVLINEKGSGERVQGELYHVDQQTLKRLDEMEGVGREGGYYRFKIDVELNGASLVSAFAYAKYRENMGTIHSGPFESYRIDVRYVHPIDR